MKINQSPESGQVISDNEIIPKLQLTPEELSKKYDIHPQPITVEGVEKSSREFLPLSKHLARVNEEKARGFNEVKNKAAAILENDHLFKMSKGDYDKYFAPEDFDIAPRLKQKNIGDCYAIAAIYSMSISPFFEIICRSSMRRLSDGTWEVDMPLLGQKLSTVIIKQEDLLPERNKRFLKRKEGKILPDRRIHLSHVEGKEGLQVLELAFIKAKFGKVDRLRAEGGHSGEVLYFYGRRSFTETYIGNSRYDENKKVIFTKTLKDLPSRKRALLDFSLNNFNPDVQMAAVGSRRVDQNTFWGQLIKKTIGFHFYKGKDTSRYFVTNHAYAISHVNSKEQTITVINPWDTSKPIEMTFDQFKGTFSDITIIEVNSESMLQHLNNFKED